MQHKDYRYYRGRQEGERSRELVKEIIAENFPNLGKELGIHVLEADRSPYYLNAKRPSSRQL